MKNLRKCVLLTIFSLFISVSLMSSNRQVRMYLPEDSIEFADDEISVELNGMVFFVDTLYEDDNGYYIVQVAMRECPGCGRHTFDTMKLRCSKCGFPDFD